MWLTFYWGPPPPSCRLPLCCCEPYNQSRDRALPAGHLAGQHSLSTSDPHSSSPPLTENPLLGAPLAHKTDASFLCFDNHNIQTKKRRKMDWKPSWFYSTCVDGSFLLLSFVNDQASLEKLQETGGLFSLRHNHLTKHTTQKMVNSCMHLCLLEISSIVLASQTLSCVPLTLVILFF